MKPLRPSLAPSASRSAQTHYRPTEATKENGLESARRRLLAWAAAKLRGDIGARGRAWMLLLAAVVGSLPFSATAQNAPAPADPDLRVYRKGGFSSMIAMGRTLFRALPEKVRNQVHFQPVNVEPDPLPFLRPEEVRYPDLPQPVRRVVVSAGFADLMNYVAHAKAIDTVRRGFFVEFVQTLAKHSGQEALPEPAGLSAAEFWTDQVLNEQESNFNQMTGILLAVELSHHYLGHYAKHAAQLTPADGTAAPPINTLLTPAEWDLALKAGTLNALEAGYAVEGVLALFEAIDKMPTKPAWTSYFVPTDFKFSKVRRELKRYEENFFAGRR